MAVTEPQVQAAFDATDGVVPPSAARAILVKKLTPLFNGGDPSVILGPDLSAIQDLTGFGVPRRVADGVWSILPVDAAGGVPLLDASGLIKRSQLSEVTLSGVVGSSLPELIRDGVAGTVTMPSVVVQGFNNAHYQGVPMRYTTAETTLSVPEGAQYFVACVIANDSTSSVQLVLKPQLSLSNCIPLYSVSRIGTQIHAIGFDTMGCGLPQKQETALLETQPYRRSTAGGLMISEDATRHVLLTPARAYAGTTPVELLAFDSNTDRLVECYHAGGAWAYSAVAQYDNSSIDNGTNKVAMGLNKWKAVWFFRSVGDDKEVFYVLGTEEYNTEAAAQVAQRPAIPDAIAWHVIFVGRSIIQNGAAVGDMQSAFVDAFSVSQISDHNLLSGLQGGAAGDYQHLTAAQVSAFAAKEPSLGNPSVSGRILSSTTAGVRSWVAPYALPTASASVLGGVKVGTGLAIASGVLSVAYGSSAGTACQGNDSRLSDARAPTAHTHPATDISGILSVNLTGFSVGINESINSSMTILAAFGAAQGQINARLTTVTADTASRAANTVYAAPNGSAGTATFRSLVPADIPNLDVAKLTSGTLGYARGGTGISAPGATAGNLRWSGSAFAIDTASYALSSAIPAASSTTPAALGTAAVGTGTTWARADHVHAMPTAAQVGAAASGHNHTLDSLSNVTISSNSAGEILRWNGAAWVNATLAEAGIQPAGSYLMGNQTITLSGIVTGSGATAITTSIADAALSIAKTNGLQAALDAKMATASYPDLVAIEALAGTSGFLKKTAANAWSLDTASYLTTTGTAAAATKLATPRTLTIGSTGKAFDGTANVAWTLAEIGAQAVLTNPVTGTGVSGRVAVWDSASSVSHSANLAYDGTALIVAGFGHMRSWTGAPTTYAGLYPISVSPGNDNFALLWTHTGTTTYLNATSKIHLQIFDGSERNSEIVIATNSVVVRSLASSQMVATDAANKLVSLDAATVRSTIGAVAASDVKEIYNWYSSATRPADCNLAPNGNGGIRSFKATGSMTTNKPPQGDSHIIHLGWDSQTPGLDSQLAVKPETGAIQMRGQTAGAWGPWRTVWDSVNLPVSVAGNDIAAPGTLITPSSFYVKPASGNQVTAALDNSSILIRKDRGVNVADEFIALSATGILSASLKGSDGSDVSLTVHGNLSITKNFSCVFVSVPSSDTYTLPASDPVGAIRIINGSVASADNPKIAAPSGSYLRYTLPDGSFHNDTTAVSIWRRHIMVQKTATDVWWIIGTLA